MQSHLNRSIFLQTSLGPRANGFFICALLIAPCNEFCIPSLLTVKHHDCSSNIATLPPSLCNLCSVHGPFRDAVLFPLCVFFVLLWCLHVALRAHIHCFCPHMSVFFFVFVFVFYQDDGNPLPPLRR